MRGTMYGIHVPCTTLFPLAYPARHTAVYKATSPSLIGRQAVEEGERSARTQHMNRAGLAVANVPPPASIAGPHLDLGAHTPALHTKPLVKGYFIYIKDCELFLLFGALYAKCPFLCSGLLQSVLVK